MRIVHKVGLQLTLYIGFIMKKFINRPDNVVEEMLRGLVLLHPGSVRLSGHKVVVRVNTEQYRDQQVAVLAGGGSGQRQPPALVARRQTIQQA